MEARTSPVPMNPRGGGGRERPARDLVRAAHLAVEDSCRRGERWKRADRHRSCVDSPNEKGFGYHEKVRAEGPGCFVNIVGVNKILDGLTC